MYSHIFGPREDDDFDEIFNTDYLDTPLETSGIQSTFDVGCNSPNFEDTQADDNFPDTFNKSFVNCVHSPDSSLSMSIQSSQLFSNVQTQDDLQRRSTSVRQTVTQEYENPSIPPTQDDSAVSPLFWDMSTNFTSGRRPISSDNIHQTMNTNFLDNVASPENSLAESRITNEASLSKLSFNSLMRRSLMNELLNPPSSAIRPTMMTQGNEDLSQGVAFSPFFNNTTTNLRSGGRQGTQNNHWNVPNMSQQIDGRSSQAYDCRSQMNLFKRNDRTCSNQSFNLNSQRQSDSHILHQNDFTSQQSTNQQILFGSYQPPSNIIDVSSLPKSIFHLYLRIKSGGSSDWTFIFALSAQMCQEFMPMNSNVTLKMGLLLSIASINTKSVPIPIIAIGQESSLANSVMDCIGNYAQRFLAPTDHLFNVHSDDLEKLVDVGPVFIAKNGVCYLGDWSGLPKKFSDEIKMMIDSGRFFINQTSENIPLGSAIWTYWISMENNKRDYVNNAVFIKYFGIPLVIDSDEGDGIIDFLLNEAINGKVDMPDDELNIKFEDMKNFLELIRKIEVKDSLDARQLLKLYSDKINVERNGTLSSKGIEIIRKMAQSFAKLSLRKIVLVCDVVAAISIAEKTFHSIIGNSPAPILYSVQDIEKADQYMESFHRWVNDYVGMSK